MISLHVKLLLWMLFCTTVLYHTIKDPVFSAGSHRLQIHRSSSLFLWSSNSVECSQHDPTLNLYYAEMLSRSYTSSKYRPEQMKNDSFSSEVLLQSPYALSLLLQTTGSWTHVPENEKILSKISPQTIERSYALLPCHLCWPCQFFSKPNYIYFFLKLNSWDLNFYVKILAFCTLQFQWKAVERKIQKAMLYPKIIV